MTSLKDRLDEAFKEWVWDAEAAKIVVKEKPTHVIFKRDLPRFKAQLIALFQQEVMAIIEESKPAVKEADKTPRPILGAVEEGFGFGEVRGVISTTKDTGFTYTEQDEENAAYEVATPYLNKYEARLKSRLKDRLEQ